MDKTKFLCLSGLILGTFLLTRHVASTCAFDRPVPTAIVILASCAIALLVCSRLLPAEAARASKGQQYDALPLSRVGHPHPSRAPSPTPEDVRYPSSLRKLRISFAALVCAVCARVAITRYTLSSMQCTVLSWEPLLPLVLASHDYWTSERQKRSHEHNGATHAESSESHVGWLPYPSIGALAVFAIGSLVGLWSASGPTSNYICASTLSNIWLVPIAQRLGTLLDLGILYCIKKLLEDAEGGGARSLSLRIGSIGWALLVSALCVLLYGTLYTAFGTTPGQRRRLLEAPPFYAWSLVKLNAISCLTLLSACIAILHVGLTTVALIATFVSLCTLTLARAWNSFPAFPSASETAGLAGFFLLVAGLAGYIYLDTALHVNSASGRRLFRDKVPVWAWLALATLLIARITLWASADSIVNYHPIDLLMFDAQVAHNSYVNQTSASGTLAEAAETYREQYRRHPPPGFEHWYKYATERDSLVIDNFNRIYEDLLPFWALSAQDIRDRTWQMMSNPWHDASGLSIRNGRVEVSPSKFMMPTHAWMLEGLVKLIGNFAEWLPDMDLAFNVNDECRVAVPFGDLQQMRSQAESTAVLRTRPQNSFSAHRAHGWSPLPEEPNEERFLREMSWQNTFNDFGNADCSPDSAAKTQRQVNLGELCTSCVAPQSIGPFLANWTLANDVCHQPDMAHLHGVYLAPAAFKASHDLYPIFSQSKVSGFHDILYPSAWNYIDKAKYSPTPEYPDPPFAGKNSSLFWRGATSEGFSSGRGQWKGMARQRFVHLANGVNGTASTKHAILVPHDTATGEHRLRYHNVPVSSLTTLLPTDVHIVGSIARCGGPDCPDQAHEFAPLAEATDFQAHWNYKYLLDLDGAGFSGRFLPFLASRSLPFKAAIFREWWDDRVTPWRHFVPLDIRGHGFWATLAYFAGFEGTVDGGEVVLEPHEKEAERIAEQGREWAGKVLRKEDMEIYFFRLLLEWGRLTDDRREEIGFAEDLRHVA